MKYDIKITGHPEFSRTFTNFMEAVKAVKMLANKMVWGAENIYIDIYTNDKANGMFVSTGEWYRYDMKAGLLVKNV